MVSSIGYSLGIGSGLDIKSIVDGLAQADRAPKEALIKRREDANAAKVSALAEAAGAIDSFAAALASLISGGTLFTQPSVSDPGVLAASAVPGARLTTLSAELEVVQLARGQTLESPALASASAPVGQGEITLTAGGASFTLTIDGSNDSLTGLAAAINGTRKGIAASIVTDQNGARLVLKSATGAAQAYSLSVPEGTASGLERFAFDPDAAGGMKLAQAAQDAIVRVDGVEIRRGTNSFKDLIQGVQIDLRRAAPGAIVTLGTTRPGPAIEQAVADFVSAHNELATILAAATAPGVGGKGAGPLRDDLSIREMRRQLAALPSTVLNSQGAIKTLAEVGVATNRDGTLTVNAGRLKQALEADPAAVEALFNPIQYSSDPAVAITSAMGKVRPGTYRLADLMPADAGAPASGKVDGMAFTASGSFLVAPWNSKAVGLVIEVKGPVAAATVTVDPGLGGALQAIRDSVRARSGPIAGSQDRLSAEAKAIARDRGTLETKSGAYYDKLMASFTTMERRVSAFKATQSYLEQQIKAWNSKD